MRLKLLSDLHLEFHRDGGRAALAMFCARYRDARVVYVHGNHELCGSDRETVHELTAGAVRENPNLVWLDVSLAEIGGQRFLGAPLWFRRHPDEPRLKHWMSDFAEPEVGGAALREPPAQPLLRLRSRAAHRRAPATALAAWPYSVVELDTP